ncbi:MULTISPECIES: hypothetical protein [unclassified Mesorhizobium]|uniref:hypothetical protein n=1 Tax=unclassified Mesorhizobium TaxID=325217 RepID=UPI00333CD948
MTTKNSPPLRFQRAPQSGEFAPPSDPAQGPGGEVPSNVANGARESFSKPQRTFADTKDAASNFPHKLNPTLIPGSAEACFFMQRSYPADVASVATRPWQLKDTQNLGRQWGY